MFLKHSFAGGLVNCVEIPVRSETKSEPGAGGVGTYSLFLLESFLTSYPASR